MFAVYPLFAAHATSSFDGKKMASGHPFFAASNCAKCCCVVVAPTVLSIWTMLIGISGCAFLKASAAGTRGASTQTVILPPESVWPPVLPPPPPEHADRASPTTANAATVVVTDNNFLVFIDTPCDVVALANTPSCTYHLCNWAEVHLWCFRCCRTSSGLHRKGNFDLVRWYYRSDESHQE